MKFVIIVLLFIFLKSTNLQSVEKINFSNCIYYILQDRENTWGLASNSFIIYDINKKKEVKRIQFKCDICQGLDNSTAIISNNNEFIYIKAHESGTRYYENEENLLIEINSGKIIKKFNSYALHRGFDITDFKGESHEDQSIENFSFSHDSKYISGIKNKTHIFIWETKSGIDYKTLKYEGYKFYNQIFSNDDQYIICSFENTVTKDMKNKNGIILWDWKKEKIYKLFPIQLNSSKEKHFSLNNTEFYNSTNSNTLYVSTIDHSNDVNQRIIKFNIKDGNILTDKKIKLIYDKTGNYHNSLIENLNKIDDIEEIVKNKIIYGKLISDNNKFIFISDGIKNLFNDKVIFKLNKNEWESDIGFFPNFDIQETPKIPSPICLFDKIIFSKSKHMNKSEYSLEELNFGTLFLTAGMLGAFDIAGHISSAITIATGQESQWRTDQYYKAMKNMLDFQEAKILNKNNGDLAEIIESSGRLTDILNKLNEIEIIKPIIQNLNKVRIPSEFVFQFGILIQIIKENEVIVIKKIGYDGVLFLTSTEERIELFANLSIRTNKINISLKTLETKLLWLQSGLNLIGICNFVISTTIAYNGLLNDIEILINNSSDIEITNASIKIKQDIVNRFDEFINRLSSSYEDIQKLATNFTIGYSLIYASENLVLKNMAKSASLSLLVFSLPDLILSDNKEYFHRAAFSLKIEKELHNITFNQIRNGLINSNPVIHEKTVTFFRSLRFLYLLESYTLNQISIGFSRSADDAWFINITKDLKGISNKKEEYIKASKVSSEQSDKSFSEFENYLNEFVIDDYLNKNSIVYSENDTRKPFDIIIENMNYWIKQKFQLEYFMINGEIQNVDFESCKNSDSK